MKTCTMCGVLKPLEDFYGARKRSDGKASECKLCKCILTRRRRRDNPSVRAHDKERNKRLERIVQRTEISRKYDQENSAEYKARYTVRKALRIGKIKKEPCVECGSDKVEAHHEDYSKPLEIIWLCPLHHRRRHAESKYGIIP